MNIHIFPQLYSDRSFRYPFYESVNRTASVQHPMYLYRFAYHGPISYSAVLTGGAKDYGAIHLDDTIYLFHADIFPEFPKNSEYAQTIQTLIKFYIDFAING